MGRELTVVSHATNTALTGTVTYSLSSYDDTVNEWTISPTSASQIRIIFTEFTMFSAEIIVEDSSGCCFRALLVVMMK